jgi:hypothetical protein
MLRMLVALLVLAASLAGVAPTQALQPLAQENPDEPTADMPPAEGEQPPAPAPSTPDANLPWWRWRSDPVPFGKDVFGMIDYQDFWEHRIRALAHPNIELELELTNVLDGEPLQREVAYLHDLQTKGQAEIVVVDHQPVVVYADDDEYVIFDTYVDRSYMVDARTRTPLGDGPNTAPKTRAMAYHIRRTYGPRFPTVPFWKVVDSVRVGE